MAMVVIVFVLPLIVFPGIERPFSLPKIVALGSLVVIMGIIAGFSGRLSMPILPRGFHIALVAWVATLGISAALGQFISYKALVLPLLIAGWFSLVISIRPHTVHLSIAMALVGVVMAGVSLLQYIGLDPFHSFGWTAPPGGSSRMRVFGTLGNPNFVAAFLVSVMPLTFALGKIFRRAWLFSLFIALQALAVFATGSRASLIAFIAIMLWLVALGWRSNLRLIAGTALVLMVLFFALWPSRSLTTTLHGRYYIGEVTAPHVIERPLFGFGPGAFEPKYVEWETAYWRNGQGSADEWEFAALQDHAHNDYLEILVDNGISGLLSFMFLIVSCLSISFHRARYMANCLLAGASAGLVALSAVALVDFPLHRPTELFIFWTLMALICLEGLATDGKVRRLQPVARQI